MMARRPKASSDVSRRIPFCWLLVTLLAGATTIVMVFSSYHSNRVSSFLIGSRALSASDTVGQLCIVVRTMPAQRYALPALLLSLFSDADTRTGVRVIVIDTDTPGKPPFDDLSDIVSTVNSVIGFHGVVVSSRHQADVLSQFSQLTTPDFGYLLTDAVLEDIIAAHAHNSRASRRYAVAHVLEPRSEIRDLGWTCEAVMTTNGDNVYAAEFFRQTHTALRLNDSDAYVQAVELTPPVIASDSESSVAGSGSASGSANTRASMGPGAAEQSRTAPLPADTSTGASMVATHWYSHYRLAVADASYSKMLRAGRCGPLRSGRFSESIVSQTLRPGCVDLGAVVLRTELLRETGARFFADSLMQDPTGQQPLTAHEGCVGHPPAYCADGALYSKLAAVVSARSAGTGGGGVAIIREPLYFHQ